MIANRTLDRKEDRGLQVFLVTCCSVKERCGNWAGSRAVCDGGAVVLQCFDLVYTAGQIRFISSI